MCRPLHVGSSFPPCGGRSGWGDPVPQCAPHPDLPPKGGKGRTYGVPVKLTPIKKATVGKSSKRRPRVAGDSLRRGRRVLAIEIAALEAAAQRLDERFERAVQILADCRGKVLVTGIGKSGLIC